MLRFDVCICLTILVNYITIFVNYITILVLYNTTPPTLKMLDYINDLHFAVFYQADHNYHVHGQKHHHRSDQ